VLPPVGQGDGVPIVAPADQHDLGGFAPADLHHRGHAGAVLLFDGVPVDVQHHLDAGVLGQVLLDHRPAVGIAAGVAGVVVQRLVVEGVDAGGVEGVGHDGPHRAHIGGPVGGAGPVPRQEPQPFGGAVAFGGVGVHDEHLGLGAVQLDGKGQRVLDLGGHLGGGDAGVVLDGAG